MNYVFPHFDFASIDVYATQNCPKPKRQKRF